MKDQTIKGHSNSAQISTMKGGRVAVYLPLCDSDQTLTFEFSADDAHRLGSGLIQAALLARQYEDKKRGSK